MTVTAPVHSARNSAHDDAFPLVIPIATTEIRPSPRNPRRRFAEEELAELAASIREYGVLEPILVRPVSDDEPCNESYELIAGERRWRATVLAGRETVPARVLEGLTDEAALKLTLIENLQRQDLDPIEEAEGYAALAELGLKQGAIAAAVNRAQPSIANRLVLLKLPESVRARISAGELSPSHGKALASYAPFPAVAEKLAALAVGGGWTSKQLEGGFGGWGWQLANARLVRTVNYGTVFDAEQCKKCPYGAYRGGYCLKPEHYDELQAAARDERQAATARAAEEARADSASVPVLEHDALPYDSYARFWDDKRPTGCSEACPCAAQMVDADRTFPICTDPQRLEGLKRADQREEAKQRRAVFDVQLEQVLQAIDDIHTIPRREMAIIVAAALSTISGRKPVDVALERHAGGRIDLDKGSHLWGVRSRYADFAQLGPIELLKVGAEALLRADLEGLKDSYRGAAPLAAWYLGAETASVPDAAPEAPRADAGEGPPRTPSTIPTTTATRTDSMTKTPESPSAAPRLGERATAVCQWCSTPFAVAPSRLGDGRGRYCSRRCLALAKAAAARVRRIERFWSKVRKTDGCWLWTGKLRHGYGSFSIGSQTDGTRGYITAHRFSWILHFGLIPEGLFVCHNCPGGDNPACVRPGHLFLGTSADNTADMLAKGREAWGELAPQSRLTAAQAAAIRHRYAAGGVTQQSLADEFGVSASAVQGILYGRTWRRLST